LLNLKKLSMVVFKGSYFREKLSCQAHCAFCNVNTQSFNVENVNDMIRHWLFAYACSKACFHDTLVVLLENIRHNDCAAVTLKTTFDFLNFDGLRVEETQTSNCQKIKPAIWQMFLTAMWLVSTWLLFRRLLWLTAPTNNWLIVIRERTPPPSQGCSTVSVLAGGKVNTWKLLPLANDASTILGCYHELRQLCVRCLLLRKECLYFITIERMP